MAREKICGIYKIENLINGKVYIGQSVNIYRRWSDHKSMAVAEEGKYRYDYPLYRAFRKYGIENFSFEIIEECSKDKLNERERFYIETYKSFIGLLDSNGYNQTSGCDGSQGCEMSDEVKQKMSGDNNAKSVPVYCEGRRFVNVGECSDFYGINRNTMNNWLNGSNNMPLEWYDKGLHQEGKAMNDYKIHTDVKGSDNPNSKIIYCDGIRYECAKDFIEENNLTYSTVMNWLNKHNYMPQEWYDRGLHLEGETMKDYKVQTGMLKGKDHPLSKAVICEGMEFSSITECTKYYGRDSTSLQDWLSHKHKMPRKWYDRGLHLKGEDMSSYEYDTKSTVVICDDIKFYSIKECANYYKVKPATMSKWLKGVSRIPQEFKNKGLKYYDK